MLFVIVIQIHKPDLNLKLDDMDDSDIGEYDHSRKSGVKYKDLNYDKFPWADLRPLQASRKARSQFLEDMKRLYYENSRDGVLFLWVKRDQHHISRIHEALGRMQEVDLLYAY